MKFKRDFVFPFRYGKLSGQLCSVCPLVLHDARVSWLTCASDRGSAGPGGQWLWTARLSAGADAAGVSGALASDSSGAAP